MSAKSIGCATRVHARFSASSLRADLAPLAPHRRRRHDHRQRRAAGQFRARAAEKRQERHAHQARRTRRRRRGPRRLRDALFLLQNSAFFCPPLQNLSLFHRGRAERSAREVSRDASARDLRGHAPRRPRRAAASHSGSAAAAAPNPAMAKTTSTDAAVVINAGTPAWTPYPRSCRLSTEGMTTAGDMPARRKPRVTACEAGSRSAGAATSATTHASTTAGANASLETGQLEAPHGGDVQGETGAGEYDAEGGGSRGSGRYGVDGGADGGADDGEVAEQAAGEELADERGARGAGDPPLGRRRWTRRGGRTARRPGRRARSLGPRRAIPPSTTPTRRRRRARGRARPETMWPWSLSRSVEGAKRAREGRGRAAREQRRRYAQLQGETRSPRREAASLRGSRATRDVRHDARQLQETAEWRRSARSVERRAVDAVYSQTATTDANWRTGDATSSRPARALRSPDMALRAQTTFSTRSAPAWRCRPPARRVIVRAADPNATLPQALLDAAARKLADDVAGFAKLFEEEPARYPAPPTLPVAGNTLDIAQGGHKQLLEWAEAYGADGVHEVKMLSQPILHITDPAIARELMFDKANEFPDRGVSAMAKFFREDQAAFVNSSGEQWMAYRKMGTASVNGSALDRLAGKVAERSEALVEKWSRLADARGGVLDVDVDQATQAVTLEVIHEALFSERLEVIDEEPERPSPSPEPFAISTLPTRNSSTISSSCTRSSTPRTRFAARGIARSCVRTSTLARTRARRSSRGIQERRPAIYSPRCSPLGIPRRARRLTRDDVNLTLTEMMVAGHDTTAATVACALTLLASDPKAMAAVRAEVDDATRRSGSTAEHRGGDGATGEAR